MDPARFDIGPRVVWLTDYDQPSTSGITGGPGGKGTVRVTVDVPDNEVHHWPKWAVAHGIDSRWYEALARGNRPETWYVVERNIPWSEWVSIERVLPTRTSERRRALRETMPPGLPWVPAHGITVKYTEAEVRGHSLTLVDGPHSDGTYTVRDLNGEVFRVPV